MLHEKILILDFGSKFSQTVARKVRDLNVFSEIKSFKTSADEILIQNYKGIIVTGPSKSINFNNYKIDKKILSSGIPILGISSGAIILNTSLGGNCLPIQEDENNENFIDEVINITKGSQLFRKCDEKFNAFVDFQDKFTSLASELKPIAANSKNDILAAEDTIKNYFAVLFHIEVNNSHNGDRIFKNFVKHICSCKGDFSISSFVDESIEQIREKADGRKVLCALSGGVDSSVCAALVSKAIGKNLTCIFVDTGLMRKNEGNEVIDAFKDMDLNLIKIDAEDRFLKKLKDVIDPEQKRKIIGEEFIRVFEEEAKKIGEVDFLVQGTIYPDIIESGLDGAKLVKSHHNVGGLPEHVDFKELIEPLRNLFKDEVRKVGLQLNLPESLVWRQPFPGPGLGIRVIGDLTKEKLDILREADYIFREEINKADLHKSINQYFVVLTNIKSVGVTKGKRTYENIAVLRAINTTDFMTSSYSKIPYEILDRITARICSEVDGINRLVYDITNKPPATIEWE
jgi:GMP synthase (glutamine-hydrolyzing), C-terminal domain or B subunit